LFAKRGYFQDVAGIPFIFGSLFMLYLGNLALVSLEHVRFMLGRLSLKKHYFLTTAARLFWLNLFFAVLGAGMYLFARLAGVNFSQSEMRLFLLYLLFLLALLDFFYLLGQLTAVLVRFRKIFFLWLFLIWFACVFFLPEINRISVFNKSTALESAEKVNLEKFRTLMAMEQKFRDFLKENPGISLDQIREMQKKFAVNFLKNSYLLNMGRETKYLHEVGKIVHSHERQSVVFPSTFYYFLIGEISSKGYYGYLDFMDYIMKLRNRFIEFYLQKRYESRDEKVESFVKGGENIFLARSQMPETFWLGLLITVCYGAAFFVLGFWGLRSRMYRS
jgi:hypothetical protein